MPSTLVAHDGTRALPHLGRKCARGLMVWAALLVGCGWAQAQDGLNSPAAGEQLSPASPEVRAAVSRAVAVLASDEGNGIDRRVGGNALIALALVKAGQPGNHSKVLRAVEEIRDTFDSDGSFGADIYSTGICIVLLTSVNPREYRREIERLIESLLARQKPHGGWGYPNSNSGDTSMTQYAVLALWEASKAGFRIAGDRWAQVATWLLRTQDPSGAFGYQGRLAEGRERVRQNEIRPTLAAAGTGSLYICFTRMAGEGSIASERPEVPPQFQPVGQSTRTQPRLSGSAIDRSWMRDAMEDGDSWLKENFTTWPNLYPYYFCYTLERYEAFKQLSGQGANVAPGWYTKIARELFERQKPEGHWQASGPVGTPVATAFAVLFLTRSTLQSLGAGLGPGTLVGGRGLPSDVSNVVIREGRVLQKPPPGPIGDLLGMLEDPGDTDVGGALDRIRRDAQQGERALLSQADRLRSLVGSDHGAIRATALTSLARARDMDDVPLLIESLSDEDPRVRLAARDGLRFISRRFDGFGFEPYGDAGQRRRAIEKWQEWYLSIRPDAIFPP